jgi:hypothetical protein
MCGRLRCGRKRQGKEVEGGVVRGVKAWRLIVRGGEK